MVDADTQISELTAPYDAVKYSKHNRFPIYFDNSVNAINPQKWANARNYEDLLDFYEF